jgi:hypothetical protein
MSSSTEQIETSFKNIIENTFNTIRFYTLDGTEYKYFIENTNNVTIDIMISKIHKHLISNDGEFIDGEIDSIMRIDQTSDNEQIFSISVKDTISIYELTKNFKIFEFFISYSS